jgi:FAD/FMN-containing dehydrogenase
VLLPDDPGYHPARSVWNATVDHRPRLIVRAAVVADVELAVRVARDLELEIGVRCGGHSAVGHAVPDDGLMIDLTPMGGVTVDPARRTAVVQGGALLGALDRAAQQYGLATTAGNVSHTGVGGLTLGGGMGWLARQYALACDNVTGFRVVTADGRTVTATATEHPDLYWGLRGGGGNFGIVTEFRFRLHDTGTRASSVEIDFPLDQAAAALRGWRELNATAPRSATFTAVIEKDTATVGYVWTGAQQDATALVPAIRSLGSPSGERIVEQSYLQLQTRSDVPGRHGRRRYSKNHYFRELSDAAIDALIGGADNPMFPGAELQAYGGAIAEVPDEETAFSHRDAVFELNAGTGWSDPAQDDDRVLAARDYAARLAPFASGAYVNGLADEGAEGVRRAYPAAKLARLTAVKDSYDPQNVFHLNANIPPSR